MGGGPPRLATLALSAVGVARLDDACGFVDTYGNLAAEVFFEEHVVELLVLGHNVKWPQLQAGAVAVDRVVLVPAQYLR